MDHIEDIYGTTDIYKAWFLCATDKEAEDTASELDKYNHTVACITMDDIEDERLRYIQKLRHFNDTARILVISYPAWYAIKEDVEVNVLPEQTLTVYGNLELDVIQYVRRQLKDASMRNFCDELNELFMYNTTPPQ